MQAGSIKKSTLAKGATKALAFVMLLVLVFSPLQPLLNISLAQAQTPKIVDAGPGEAGCNSVGSCIASVVYVFTAGLGSGLAYMGSWFFSVAVRASLISTTYTLSDLSWGWTTVRDIANMAFIFILIYIAFTIMLKAETTGTMQMLARVIIIALVINFSFFFVRVVIDTGNILATQFYNTLPNDVLTTDMPTDANSTSNNLGGGTKDLSASIMKGIGLQGILSTENFARFQGGSNWLTELIVLSFVYLAVGVIYFLLAGIFFTIGIKFIARIVILWLVIIAAPLALVFYTMKGTRQYFEQWLHALIVYSLFPAIFLFIFSIVVRFAGRIGNVTQIFTDLNANAQSLNNLAYFGALIASIGIRLGLVILFLYLALKISDAIAAQGGHFANTITGKMGDFMRGGVGLGFRGVANTAAFAGRNTLGRLGYNVMQNPRVQQIARQSGGRDLLWQGASKLANSTYNPRKAPGGSVLRKASENIAGGRFNIGRGPKNKYQPTPATPPPRYARIYSRLAARLTPAVVTPTVVTTAGAGTLATPPRIIPTPPPRLPSRFAQLVEEQGRNAFTPPPPAGPPQRIIPTSAATTITPAAPAHTPTLSTSAPPHPPVPVSTPTSTSATHALPLTSTLPQPHTPTPAHNDNSEEILKATREGVKELRELKRQSQEAVAHHSPNAEELQERERKLVKDINNSLLKTIEDSNVTPGASRENSSGIQLISVSSNNPPPDTPPIQPGEAAPGTLPTSTVDLESARAEKVAQATERRIKALEDQIREATMQGNTKKAQELNNELFRIARGGK
ncbi:type IV secretion system protein [Acetobacteraceae bacterium]|nr:type IV secretion system protein [Candidatus Parcubacteria bacterium]